MSASGSHCYPATELLYSWCGLPSQPCLTLCPGTPSSWADMQPPQSVSTGTVCGSCSIWDLGGDSSSSIGTAVSRPWFLSATGYTAQQHRAEGTETSLSTQVQTLWRLLSEEHILNSSKWILLQNCTARRTRLGSSSGSCSTRRAQGICSHMPTYSLVYMLTCVLTHTQLDF